jgi:hypothetical protein
MRKAVRLFGGLGVFSAAAMLFMACGTRGAGFGGPNGVGAAGDPDGSPVVSSNAGRDAMSPPIGTVTGTVVAPEGTIPISGALIYLTDADPPPIPSGVYCDKCVELTSYAFTYSKADGTFELPAYIAGAQYIVTQKGQFRRVRKLDVKPGTQVSNADDTRLPGKNDAANGDTIPRMKVMAANWDSIQSSLKKLGISEFTGPPTGFVQDHALDDLTEASKYHIIFIPCSGQVVSDPGPTGSQCSSIYTPSSASKSVMKNYIEQGGKLYVTDWSYEYVQQIWPGFVTFTGETSQVGSACTIGEYSGPAQFDDPGLAAWMTAIGEGSAQLKKNYVSISGTTPQPGLDQDGHPVTITPKVWASTVVGGTPHTSTVSFQDKCGRVMYSTYHAEGTDNGGSSTLLAQEKALFHILLEVSACVGVKPVPPVR